MLRAAVGWAVLLGLGLWLDNAARAAFWVSDDGARALMESKDWYRMLRVMGSVYTWMVISPVLVLAASPDRSGGRRDHAGLHGLLPLLVGALSGAAAELLKLVIRRGRPEEFESGSGWIAYGDSFFSNSRMGMPSSHAAVAFGAAFALTRMYPRTGWVLLPIAMACGLTRVASGQHYLSDVVGGAAVGWLLAHLLVAVPSRGR